MQGCGRSEPVPADIGWEAGYTLDRLPVHQSPITGLLEEAGVAWGNRHNVTVSTAVTAATKFPVETKLQFQVK